MNRVEFAKVMGYLALGCGKSLSDGAMEVYFDLLGDLPIESLQCAAKRVLLEHPWSTFPSAAELGQAASETSRGVLNELSPAEAWEMAWDAVGKIDLHLDMRYTVVKACNNLPPIVYEAMKAFGFRTLVDGKDSVNFVRPQFMKIYEQLAARDRRTALLPDSLKRNIAEIGHETLQPPNILKIHEIGRSLDAPAPSVACQSPRADAPVDFRTVAQKQTQALEQERLAEDAAWDRCMPERKSELFARLAREHPGAAQRPEILDRPCRRLALEEERSAAKAAG